MRLLQIVADGRPGGGTTVVVGLAEDLAGLGHEVCVVTQRDSYAYRRVLDVGAEAVGLPLTEARFNPPAALALRRAIASFRPQIIHAHGGRACAHLNLSFPRTGCPVVYTVHGYHFLGKSWGIRHAAALAERHFSRFADTTVFVSDYDRRVAHSWRFLADAARGVVIHNGLEPYPLQSELHADTRTVGFLGRLTFQKDPLLFIEVMKLLAAKGYRAKVIGDGEMAGAVKRSVEDAGLSSSMRFLGALPREQALREIADVGVLVLTSRWEGLPTVVLEAMHLGVPVVAAAVGGTDEIVESGVSGILVHSRNPRDFADAVEKITSNGDLRQSVIQQGKDVVASRFSRMQCTERHLTLYGCLATGRVS